MSAVTTSPTSDLTYVCRVLKAPALAAAAARLANRAQADNWSHEQYLAACLEREVAARESHGGEARIKAARFPTRKSLEDFDDDHERSIRRDVIAHLCALDFVVAKENVVSLGPQGRARPTSPSASRCTPARPATECSSPPPRSGSPGSPRPTPQGRCRPSSSASGAIP